MSFSFFLHGLILNTNRQEGSTFLVQKEKQNEPDKKNDNHIGWTLPADRAPRKELRVDDEALRQRAKVTQVWPGVGVGVAFLATRWL